MSPIVLVPAVVVAAAFVGFCWYDLSRQTSTAHLPRWAWAIVCVISVPFGGIAYLIAGREPSAPLTDEDLT